MMKKFESTSQTAMHPFKKLIAAYKASENSSTASTAPAQSLPASTEKKSFICDLCKHSFAQSSELKKHKETFHSRTCTNVCKVCDKRFQNPAILVRHMITHTGVRSNRSDFRDKTIGQTYNTNPQKNSHHQNTCNVCGSRFVKSFELRRHSKTHTPSENLHTCAACSKNFISPSQLGNHSLTHTYGKP